MRNWGSRTDRRWFSQAVPKNNKRMGMSIRERGGLFFVKGAPILIIILAFLFNSVMTTDYLAWAKKTDTPPSPIGKDASADPGQVFLLIPEEVAVMEEVRGAVWVGSDFLRPRPITERNGGLLNLAPTGDKQRALDYSKRTQLHRAIGDNTVVVLRNGGPVLVYGLGRDGELIGARYVVSGEAVEVKAGALPRYIPTDKIPPEGPEAVEVIGLPSPTGDMVPRPVDFEGMRGMRTTAEEIEFSL